MQNRYTADIGDYLKLGILRALSPGHRLGVAWWLYPDESHNKDGRHIDYLNQPGRWRHFDRDLFDALAKIVTSGQRDIRGLEAANVLPGAIFANEMIPLPRPIDQRQHARHEWFLRLEHTLTDADLVFVDPDNGLPPTSFSYRSAKAGKSVTFTELRELVRPGRCLIVYHHHTRRAGGHHAEIDYWADRLRAFGFATVDALRANPYSPRVFLLLNAPADIRQRAEKIEEHWNGLITWHPDNQASGDIGVGRPPADHPDEPRRGSASILMASSPPGLATPRSSAPMKLGRLIRASTTQVGYVNRSDQEVIRPTGNSGTDHGQYVYVLRCRTCGHEYGANGSDIWLRRCPAHDGGALGLAY